MAYTHQTEVSVGGSGNNTPTTPNYYSEDLMIVYTQNGVNSFGPLNVNFRNGSITVIAAWDVNENVLQKMALPCPPYHEPTQPEAKPGKFLSGNAFGT